MNIMILMIQKKKIMLVTKKIIINLKNFMMKVIIKVAKNWNMHILTQTIMMNIIIIILTMTMNKI